MRDTVTNLSDLLMGQVGKNIQTNLKNRKKIKNPLAGALEDSESSAEASATGGDSKSKHRTSALQAQASKQTDSSTLGTGSQVAATGAASEASSFQAVLVKVSGQTQAKEAKESPDADSVKAVAPIDSSPAGQSLAVTQYQAAPAVKTATQSQSEALTADSVQTRSEQAAQDSAVRQASQQTVQPAPVHALHAQSFQPAGSQSKQPVETVNAAAVQAKPVASATADPSAKVVTAVSESQPLPKVSGQTAQQTKAQAATDYSLPLSQGAARVSTAKTETKTSTQASATNAEQVTPGQTKKDSAPQQTISQPASQQAPQAQSPQPAAVQWKPPVQAADVAPSQAKSVAQETPVTSAKAMTDVSQEQQVSDVSGQRTQQAKGQPGEDDSESSSGGVASAAMIVSEAPSVKSSVVASGGASKQAALSVTASSAGVSAGAFHAAATQALANSDAAQAAAGSGPAVPAAADQTSSSLTGQIAQAVASVGPSGLGHQMVIQLNPPELGRVRLTLESRDDQIRGVLRVDDPGTLTQLRQEVPTLLHRLSENGLDVRQMDVVSSHQGSAQSQTFGQGQDGQTARQQQSSPWRSASPATVSQTTLFNQATPAEDAQYVGGGSINTLV
jgi:flagellar hook-length control protein FliK